ncbi:MAG: KEOPS complex subunit Cgi121 [Promethearchaeati archaeon]
MINEDFSLEEPGLNYSIIISTLELKKNIYSLDELFRIINEIQDKFEDSIIQFFNDEYVLNNKHIFYAIYFSEKAFKQKINISNKKSIEFLLYLSANRQIKIAIQSFGIKIQNLKRGILNLCIASQKDQVREIYRELIDLINVKELKTNFNVISREKINKIRKFFEISDNQIFSILKTSNLDKITNIHEVDPSSINDAILDLICEKMALLSLEGVSFD